MDGRHLAFGVSGLLNNSDLLMYDHQTESLWSQIEGRAVSGPFAGRELEPVAIRHELWQRWQERVGSAGQVLSTDTGNRKNYRISPYGDYDHSKRLYFPVTHTSRKYHPKTWVLGWNHNGERKAWPFPELADHGAVLEDRVGGKTISRHYIRMYPRPNCVMNPANCCPPPGLSGLLGTLSTLTRAFLKRTDV